MSFPIRSLQSQRAGAVNSTGSGSLVDSLRAMRLDIEGYEEQAAAHEAYCNEAYAGDLARGAVSVNALPPVLCASASHVTSGNESAAHVHNASSTASGIAGAAGLPPRPPAPQAPSPLDGPSAPSQAALPRPPALPAAAAVASPAAPLAAAAAVVSVACSPMAPSPVDGRDGTPLTAAEASPLMAEPSRPLLNPQTVQKLLQRVADEIVRTWDACRYFCALRLPVYAA